MRQLSTTGILLLALASSGCVSWPDKGRGGMAEKYPSQGVPVMPNKPLGPEHGLRFEYELVKQQLAVLILEGAELCFPATVVQAREKQNRIARELQGGLGYDAANDLIVQRKLLERLEKQLDYVKQHRGCQMPVQGGDRAPREMGRKIYELLNSDNQFASNSSRINPKYMGRLAEAAQLLKNQPGYRLRVTGHADATGAANRKDDLAMARAEQVKRYLLIFGLAPKRISIDAVGADNPLFKGEQSHVRLTNRRVSIELVETTTTPEAS
jgi:outer membrane protein OmpA-like peptidoglycan-associated protein